ncbi:hypothetical protein N9M41_04615 [Rhodopirellula sp.]|nr:hypothetical protein [Rhodopirellula sp.]
MLRYAAIQPQDREMRQFSRTRVLDADRRFLAKLASGWEVG